MLDCIPQTMKIVEAITPQAGAAITGDYVSLKNCPRCFVVVHINQADVAPVAITIEKATNVAMAGTTAITTNVPIWANEDCAASDTLVRQSDGISHTTSAATKHKVIVFQVDADTLGAFDCITVKTAASNAANITSAMYYLSDYAYQQSTPPTAITD